MHINSDGPKLHRYRSNCLSMNDFWVRGLGDFSKLHLNTMKIKITEKKLIIFLWIKYLFKGA